MEVSVSFTGEDVWQYAQGYNVYESQIGRVYVPAKGIIIEEPAAIRYERHPWIEAFELDGIRPQPARREGFGVKSVQGFLMSLGKVYGDVQRDYAKFSTEAGFDAEGFFSYVTGRMVAEAQTQPQQFRRFAGFTENMWRLGNKESYRLAMETVIPRLRKNTEVWRSFTDCVTEEFRDEVSAMKTLCLYYSRTNTTRVIARRIAMLLGADLFEYTDGKDRSGFKGYVASCIDSFKEPPKVHIIGDEPDWDAYDRVIVAMPTWVEAPSVVGRGFLQQYSGKFKGSLYLVVTHMAAADYEKPIRKLYGCSIVAPTAHLSVQTKNHDPEAEIQRFVRSIS